MSLEQKIVTAREKLLTSDFKRRAFVEEQKVQQEDRFLKLRQIAYMMSENFKISGNGEALLNLERPDESYVEDHWHARI